ncbi:hypothetical protein L2737_19635 [Shewanella electrodiphila]|uniref:Uncharacterized protein n=1 Tax=Shewanella electrodiphila TaxID=934143 RepID=A0ABT0KUJ8_9GAMM|nr:hypothetical protein [Shewanella electrodiphila]MCL1047517.1 hypothetical protein [Shewanella electrodiphila]
MANMETDELFTQVRTAHRLLAAFYQRLLPSIEQIAKGLDVDFYTWSPKEFGRPAQLSTNPFDRWGWDMLPALSTYYVFKHVEDNNKVRVGEYLVEFLVETDTVVKSDLANGAEPDALNLPQNVGDAKSTLKISVYAPCENSESNWHHNVWNECENHPACETPEPIKDPDTAVVYCGFEVPLADLMKDGAVDVLIARAQEFIDITVEQAKSLSLESV